jgi:poly(3-hydroxybutyrate) depolymerase
MRNWILWPLALLALLPAHARQLSKDGVFNGVELHYKVILPEPYDPAQEYPAVIAFPGGAQTMPMVDGVIARNWRREAEKRGYIVAVLSAPAEGLFYAGGAKAFPAFLDQLKADYKIRGGKFHIAGISNGGISSFHLAASHPAYFSSVTGFPGYLPDATPARVDALQGMCIHMYAGELDGGWVSTMADQAGLFQSKGLKARFTVEKGQGHVMRTLEGEGAARLFDNFEAARAGCR